MQPWEQWKVDWYRELLDRLLAGETLSGDDHQRLNYFMDLHYRELAANFASRPPSTFYVRNSGEAAIMRVPGSGR